MITVERGFLAEPTNAMFLNNAIKFFAIIGSRNALSIALLGTRPQSIVFNRGSVPRQCSLRFIPETLALARRGGGFKSTRLIVVASKI